MEDTRLTVKVEKDLKKAFLLSCKAQDLTASQAIRFFMRSYIAKKGQQDIFKS